MSQTPTLKDESDLSLRDFQIHPVWVSVHTFDEEEPWYEDTNEETVRPWLLPFPVEPAENVRYIVRASLKLADGSTFDGCVTPQPQASTPDLYVMNPRLFSAKGQAFGFCYTFFPAALSEDKLNFYSAIDKLPGTTFPIHCSAGPKLSLGVCAVTVPGFWYFADGKWRSQYVFET